MSGAAEEYKQPALVAMFGLQLYIEPAKRAGREWFLSADFQTRIAAAAYLAGVEPEMVQRFSEGRVSDGYVIADAIGRVYLLAIATDLMSRFGLQVQIEVIEITEGSSKVVARLKATAQVVTIVTGILGSIAQAPTVIKNIERLCHQVETSIHSTTHHMDRTTHSHTKTTVTRHPHASV